MKNKYYENIELTELLKQKSSCFKIIESNPIFAPWKKDKDKNIYTWAYCPEEFVNFYINCLKQTSPDTKITLSKLTLEQYKEALENYEQFQDCYELLQELGEFKKEIGEKKFTEQLSKYIKNEKLQKACLSVNSIYDEEQIIKKYNNSQKTR